MNYVELLNKVGEALDSKNVEYGWDVGEKVTPAALASAEKDLRGAWPKQLAEFYKQVGDGVSLDWDASTASDRSLYSILEIPSIEELVKLHRFIHDEQLHETMSFIESQADGELKDHWRSIAKDQELWVPFHDVGNGDDICIDMLHGERVIYLSHEGMPELGEQVPVMAGSFDEFLTNWSRVCFQWCKGAYWPACITPKGVDWNGPEFREPRF